MICSSPTPHASKLASTEMPDVVALLLLLDVVAVRVGVAVAAAAAACAAAVIAFVVNAGVVSLLLCDCCWSSLDVVAAALANVAVAAFACSSAHFDFTAVLRASTSHAAPCTHTRRLQTR